MRRQKCLSGKNGLSFLLKGAQVSGDLSLPPPSAAPGMPGIIGTGYSYGTSGMFGK